jgi:Uma2 family endonuclease
MALDRSLLTYEDYLAWPEDGVRREILDGEMVVSPSPATLHQLVLGNLYDLLRGHVRAHGLGSIFFAPPTVVLANTTVVEPDLFYIEAARSALLGPRGVHGAPTLLVEVLSPSTASVDPGRKSRLYARLGVPYYWIVDTDGHAIEAYEAEAGAYRLVARGSGDTPVALPPFADLAFAPESLWQP